MLTESLLRYAENGRHDGTQLNKRLKSNCVIRDLRIVAEKYLAKSLDSDSHW